MGSLGEIRSDVGQIVDRMGWQGALALGSSVLAISGFVAEQDAFAQGLAPGQSHIGDPLATASSASAAECEALALARPTGLSGTYESDTIPNDNWYQIRGGVSSLKQCDGEGVRDVRGWQQKQELGYGLHPKLVYTLNGLPANFKGNQAKKLDFVTRAYHGCLPRPIDAYGDSDKIGHIKARPAMTETWTPTEGPAKSVTFTGTPSLVCK